MDSVNEFLMLNIIHQYFEDENIKLPKLKNEDKIAEENEKKTKYVLKTTHELKNVLWSITSVFDELNIVNKNHPRYNDFVKKMKNPVFKSEKCTINKDMLNLTPVSFIDILK